MLKDVLQSIEGIGIYPFVGLIMFVCAFLVAIVLTGRMRKGEVDYAGRLPLDDGTIGAIPGSCARTDERQGDDT